MNINFNINGSTVAVGRKTRTFFKEAIEWNLKRNKHFFGSSMENGTIDDQTDYGVEWELCESLGLNPAKYVGRIGFRYQLKSDSENIYDVAICTNKVA